MIAVASSRMPIPQGRSPTIHDPTTGRMPSKLGQRVEGLEHGRAAVGTARARRRGAPLDDGDVRPFPRVDRLSHPAVPERLGIGLAFEEGRQQVRMVGREPPQQRQYALARQHHLPGRLDHVDRTHPGRRAEWIAQQPLPRVELEQHVDRRAPRGRRSGRRAGRCRRCAAPRQRGRPGSRCRRGNRRCPGPRRCPWRRECRRRPGHTADQRSINASWMEVNWSAPRGSQPALRPASSQCHWNTAAS